MHAQRCVARAALFLESLSTAVRKTRETCPRVDGSKMSVHGAAVAAALAKNTMQLAQGSLGDTLDNHAALNKLVEENKPYMARGVEFHAVFLKMDVRKGKKDGSRWCTSGSNAQLTRSKGNVRKWLSGNEIGPMQNGRC